MRVRKSIDFNRSLSYFFFGAAALLLHFVGNNAEPFSLALAYALCAANFPLLPCAMIGILPAVFATQWITPILQATQISLLILSFWAQRALQKNNRHGSILSSTAFAVGLGLYVAFAPFHAYPLPFAFGQDPLIQKTVCAAGIFLLSAIFTVAVNALTKKVLKRRLRGDELLFSILLLLLIGVGACRFLGFNAYMGIAFFVLLLFSYVTKDALACVCAFLLSIPPFLVFDYAFEAFFVYGVVITLFVKSGRLAAALALLICFFGNGYFNGLYQLATLPLVQAVLSVTLPSLFFILLPTPVVRSLENKLIFYREKHLSRVAINRNRAAVGEKLYELSAVFREIEFTFSSLSTREAEESAKEFVRAAVENGVCKHCPNFNLCSQKGLNTALGKLVEVGCLKGKTSLIDIPRALTETCNRQSDLLYAVNGQIGEYKRYMLETENAAVGRKLLSAQAKGVSEILRTLALEQSEPLKIYTDKERALNVAFLGAGLICSEVLIYGEEDDLTLSLITFGSADVKKIAAVASEQLGAPMIISQKLTLDNDKFCCIFRKKTYFDAAFGVASVRKSGESASGDTHTVIKIDERRFLVALSDGMGSGEYAKRVSESTLSLLESFYRAKMPPPLILSTVNTLLTFSREESFACLDIAVIDLDDGRAEIVKIGSPIGFILSGNTVKVLENNSLPLGILDAVRPQTATYRLHENDVVLFLSDGVVEAFGSESDLYDALRTIPIGNPQLLADTLIQDALRLLGNVAKDDMTALAVRLFKQKGEI